MTVIYLDELFLLNFVVDYLLLLAAGRLSGEVLRRGWLALGAAIGAAYAAAAVLPGMGFLLHPLCKLGVAVLALLAGYGKSRRLLRVSLVFFAVSAAFGGGVFALQLLGGRGLTLQNGIFYSAMDLRLILLSAAGCYVLITLLFQRTARHSGLRRELVPAVLTLEGRRVALTALVDTGNTLTDPATGRPVMVAEGEKVGALFPDGQAPAPEELRRPVETLERLGKMPLPPYIKEELQDQERYQTVYSKVLGSAAAPTAGLHFTPELLEQIKAKGVNIGYVTLHVGLGTFRPVKEDEITDHEMHSEYCVIPQETADLINETKRSGGRVICVGTTSCRTIESWAAEDGTMTASAGWTDIFIYPGYRFKVLDGLITNFHLPESTLIMLVSAFAGREHVLAAYEEAVREKYRFFSFGDAMFLR